MTLFFLSVGIALGFSFVCSLLEATLLSFSPSQVAALESKRPKLGKVWRHFKNNIEKPIAVILVTNTTAHTVGATLAGAQFEKAFGAQGLIVFSIIFTYLMLQFTEILPKSLGVRYSGYLAPLIAPPLQVLIRVMGPVLWFIHLVNRPFAGGGQAKDETLEEIAALAASARLSRLIDPHQARMIQAASDIDDIWVRQIMTPRTEVVSLFVQQPLHEILKVMGTSPYTRMPLCDGSVDNIIGMVHFKDVIKLLELTPRRLSGEQSPPPQAARGESGIEGTAAVQWFVGADGIELKKIRRDVIFLPEHIVILQALRRFQEARTHMAIVLDEHGSTLGLLTLEDVLEEIVGDIKDEFDLPSPELIKQEGDAFRVSGRFPLHELALHVPDLGIDHSQEDVDTVGGYVTQVMRKIPVKGEFIDVGPYRWTVASADGRRVCEVMLSPLHSDDAPEGN